MRVLRVITLAGDVDREAEVAAGIAGEPQIDLVMRCVERAEALACLRGGGLDAVVAVGPVRWFDYQCVEEARGSGIRLLGHAADPIEAELLEVVGFSVLAPDASLADIASLESAVPPTISIATSSPGKRVAVWGPKGAPGRTTVAIEVATVLASTEPSTLLVDADLYGGDIMQLLGIVEELPSLVAVARACSRGELRDGSFGATLKRVGPSGPKLLPGLLRAELWNEVATFGWRELLNAAAREFRYAIFDVGFCLEQGPDQSEASSRNDTARATVETAEVVLSVVRGDPVGIRSFLWAVDAEPELLAPEKLLVVANRVRPGEEREIKAIIRRHLGHYPLVLVPERPDHVVDAVWKGEPIGHAHPASPIAESARTIAAALGAAIPPKGFLSRLVGRRIHV